MCLYCLCVQRISLLRHDLPACYGEIRVTLLRPRSLYRVAALLLLFMTGLDLSMDLGNVSFCAIDAERTQAGAASEAAVTTASHHSEQGTAPHIDDCFCCSACVNVTPIEVPIEATLVATEPVPPVARQLPLLSRFLFHPPQLLS